MGCGSTKVVATDANSLFCLSCIDGRAKNRIMGSPGGDAGNLFRCILACQKIVPSAKLQDEEKMTKIIKEVCKNLKHHLYYHTDSHAIHDFDPLKGNPEDASLPCSIGCGYFKVCTTTPEKLEEDEQCAEMAKLFLRTLVKSIQSDAKEFDVVTLEGDHAENQCKLFKHSTPYQADGKTFIYHPQVEYTQGEILLRIIFKLYSELDEKKTEIIPAYHTLCTKHWEKTIGILFPGGEIQTIE